jgi:hypothetical protein
MSMLFKKKKKTLKKSTTAMNEPRLDPNLGKKIAKI